MSAGTTALVIAFPELEPVVGEVRARYDASAAAGVPPHVTVLFPFLAVGAVDEAVVAALGEVAAGCPDFAVTFAGCARFPHAVYLEPGPAEPFATLTRAVWRRWPDRPPYGGAFGDSVVPHLTVAHDRPAEDLDAAEAEVARALPTTARAAVLTLLAFDGARWTEHLRLALGTGARR